MGYVQEMGGHNEKRDYFLVSLSKHANAVKAKLESRKVRENWVRKPYGRDSVKLASVTVIQG
jgi:hypothetical protein